MSQVPVGKPVSKPLFHYQWNADGTRKGQRQLNDPATFEITQNAAQHVASGAGSAELALDIGNGFCGEPILATQQGWASRVVDPARQAGAISDALGIRIDHGAGVWTEYWHLNGWAVPEEGAFVTLGQVIGYLGSTGLGGACHCHLMLKIGGRAVDPEPYIFGAALEVEDQMQWPARYRPVYNRRARLGEGNRLRTSPNLADDPGARLTDRGYWVVVLARGKGATRPGYTDDWYLVYVFDTSWFVHASLLPSLEPIEKTLDCSIQVAAAIAEERERVAAGLEEPDA